MDVTLPPTSSSSSSGISSPSSSSSSNLDDIQYLLHLESLKRYMEDAKNIQRQMEEQTRVYLDIKHEYQCEFARLVRISKQINVCEALDDKHTDILEHPQLAQMAAKLPGLSAALATDRCPTNLDVRALEECKELLRSSHRSHPNLAKQQMKLASNMEAVKELRTMLNSVENAFESTTLVAMDQLTVELQPQNT